MVANCRCCRARRSKEPRRWECMQWWPRSPSTCQSSQRDSPNFSAAIRMHSMASGRERGVGRTPMGSLTGAWPWPWACSSCANRRCWRGSVVRPLWAAATAVLRSDCIVSVGGRGVVGPDVDELRCRGMALVPNMESALAPLLHPPRHPCCALLLISHVRMRTKGWNSISRDVLYHQFGMTCFEDLSDDILFIILDHVGNACSG
jgi:hypothetical protein